MKEKTVNSKTAKVKSKKSKTKAAESAAVKNDAPAESAALVKESAADTALVVPADSLNAPGDLDAHESAADGSNAVGDAAQNDAGMPALPTAEQLGITITAGNAGNAGSASGNAAGNVPLSATVGDTINFPVTVSWSVNGSAILVVPTSSANAKGILQLGVSQESSRSVKDGKEMAQITFNYKLVMQDTGNLNIPAMRFEIPTPMGQSLDLRSDSVPIRVDAPFNAMPFIAGGAVGVCVLLAALWRMRKRANARAAAAAKNAFENAMREKMVVLKQRVMVADSREWLLELEGICKEYAFKKFGAAEGIAASAVNLDALVADGKLDGWKPLLEEFAHARYGGGKRDSFENKETWKLAMQLMGIKEDE
ncbi:BatD family protein [Fibrobacter sp. UWB7]|uniref:BatD family protein n=1 Tax=Fibrobacter sp. UWB7 TaxID=1896206 RepID=UPI0009F8CDD1|nr:BatD family protein [Fibrobacter sp. UWB7]